MLRLSLTEFSLPKFYLLFGISKVKSAAVIAFRSSYRDRSFSPGSYERETFVLSSLETVTEALLEIMEVGNSPTDRCIDTDRERYTHNTRLCLISLTQSLTMFSGLGVHEGHSRLQVAGPVD